VATPYGDGGGGASVTEVDCCSWCVSAVVVSVSELTVIVLTPASDLAVVKQGAGVVKIG